MQTKTVIILHPGQASIGGIANATLFFAAALREAGYSAEVWTSAKDLAARCAELAIPFFHHDQLKSAGVSIVSPKIAARAFAARRNAAAVIHQGARLWLFGRIWLRGVPESVVFQNDKIGQRGLFRRWLVISETRRAELEAYASSRGMKREIRAIRNGPLPAASKAIPRSGAIRTIGCMGNFGNKKAVDMLVRAFAAVCSRGHDVSLVLAGDGPERSLCESLAENLGVAHRITWPGWLTDTQEFFQNIDLFVLPSRNEPFGIVVTEAMQAALPVVATSTRGPLDIVIPGETGWLVPPEDPTALADAIEDGIKNPEKARTYSINGYERFQKCYSLHAVGKILADVHALPGT
ncbi:MAG: glycosyltransferase family 4 protein [Rhodomicrobium sp.]